MAEPGAPADSSSMEAILASIKRVIQQPVASAAAALAPSAPAPEDDVLELGAVPPEPAPSPPAMPSAEPEALVSDATRLASTRAMAALAAISIDPAAPAHTLDGLVRELLRPMLKEWLDANLPELVERVVAREVARLVGR